MERRSYIETGPRCFEYTNYPHNATCSCTVLTTRYKRAPPSINEPRFPWWNDVLRYVQIKPRHAFVPSLSVRCIRYWQEMGLKALIQVLLTRCGLVKPYGDINLRQHRIGEWLVAYRHQGITWNYVDLLSVRSCHMIWGKFNKRYLSHKSLR